MPSAPDRRARSSSDLAIAAARGDDEAVRILEISITTAPSADVEAIVTNVCVAGDFAVFDRVVIANWSAIADRLLSTHHGLRHQFVNSAVQGANLDIIRTMCRLTNLDVTEVEDRIPAPASSSPPEGFEFNVVTPLLVASVGGHIEVVQYLLDQGVDANAGRTRDGNSPLGMASIHGHAMVVDALLAAGASVSHTNAKGENIRALAAAFGHTDVLLALPRAIRDGGVMPPPARVHAVDEASIRNKIQSIRQSSSHTDYSLAERGGDVDLTPLQRRIAVVKARMESSRKYSTPTSSDDEVTSNSGSRVF
ncbi:hypothetical protein DYB32_004325 [Aphanomyces invadans]|uniref:Uncharacterized protein n=1 Tax=Aphanomyces invadans TaxID=157072 RepID=A0A3R6Z7U7_9STRA|nr:hypothetical protein DYB32_004325 [Aphanomyces invadans]